MMSTIKIANGVNPLKLILSQGWESLEILKENQA